MRAGVWRLLFGSLVLSVVMGFALVAAEPLHAAPLADTLEVDRLDDPPVASANTCSAAPNDCSLRGAVDAAVGGDTIVVATAGTITLGSEIGLSKNITISSASATDHIIDGGNSSRIFGIGSGQTVILEELTLQNGFTSSDGAAIDMAQGTLTMTHVIVQENFANGEGGGLSVIPSGGTANVYLTNVAFLNNTANATFNSGGAIHAFAGANRTINLWIEGGTFTGNTGGQISVDERDGYGGAIAAVTLDGNSTLNLEIRDTEFISNVSGYSGALYLNSYARGGDNSVVHARVEDSHFAENVGEDGGGIYAATLDGGSTTTLVISNTTFMENSATNHGGAIRQDNLNRGDAPAIRATTTIYNSVFANNDAEGVGGAIYSAGNARSGSGDSFTALEVVNSTFSGNRAGGNGGAILAETLGISKTTGVMTLTHVTIFDNTNGGQQEVRTGRNGNTTHEVYVKNSLMRGTGAACGTGGITWDGANNFIHDATCGDGAPFRLGLPTGIVPTLANNGGPTLTHALFEGSSALDAVPAGECTIGNGAVTVTTDQRSEPRPFGAACDVGAFEAQSNSLPTQTAITGVGATSDAPTLLGAPTLFTATVSGGDVEFYKWDFGDGNSGSGMTASHTYTEVGTYNVVLTAINAVGSPSTNLSVTVEDPITGLSASNDGPTLVGNPTQFEVEATGGTPESYAWDFGDGNNGSGNAPSHTYGAVGTYTATVVATNASNSITATTVVQVVSELPDAITGLDASNDGPTVLGAATTFDTEFTGGTPDSYTWNFGDGTTGSGATPSHTYAASGIYTATVEASNANNSVSATTTVYVADAVVEVRNNFYSPADVTIPPGGTVLWVLVEGNHSVTASDSSFEQPAGSNWPPFMHTFELPESARLAGTAATFTYFCTVHGQSMSGSVTVDEDALPGGSGLYMPKLAR